MDKPTTARRSDLDVLAGYYGVRRRWFGLEPDRMLRRRTYAAITRSLMRRPRINWWDVWAFTLSGLALAVLFVVALMFALAEPMA